MGRLKRAIERFPRPDGVPEGSIVTVFRVADVQAGQRLDLFLKSELRRTSRTRTQEIISQSAYGADGKRLRSNHRLQAEEHVCLWRAPWDETPVPTDIPVLFEDDHLLVVNKPALVPVHPTARYHRNTVIKILQSERPGAFVSLGHRIDRETSGVLVLLKTPEADRSFKMSLENRDDIDKEYLAITWGHPTGLELGVSRRYERHIALDLVNPLRVVMGFASEDAPGSLYSATRFVMAAKGRGAVPHWRGSQDYALVRCLLETGRQHQIRLHLLGMEAPIVGDKIYGPDDRMFARFADGETTAEDLATLEIPRHALHASRLTFAHPMTGQRLSVFAPLPDDMAGLWRSLGGEGDREAELDEVSRPIQES